MNKDGAILIMGANGGIGSALARELTYDSRPVILAGRDMDALNKLGAELDSPAIYVDSIGIEATVMVYEEAEKLAGKIYGTVNCVGSSILKPSHTTSSEEWHALLSSNLTSAFAVVKGALRVMIKNGGSIVLISAACARIGMAYHDTVAATKAGIIGLTLSAAATYANRSIRVNCVSPGLINTAMTDSIIVKAKQLFVAESSHPISRIGEPSDVVSAILWFMQTRNSWITGHILGVDEGLGSLLARQSK
jgi:3-oxoacyl-[acyl-carrier protein] reductase